MRSNQVNLTLPPQIMEWAAEWAAENRTEIGPSSNRARVLAALVLLGHELAEQDPERLRRLVKGM
jgi:hypothetical protein